MHIWNFHRKFILNNKNTLRIFLLLIFCQIIKILHPKKSPYKKSIYIYHNTQSEKKPKLAFSYVIFCTVYLINLTIYRYSFDYHDGEVYWCTADIGWITGHSYIVYGPMANGATSVMVNIWLFFLISSNKIILI